jgi:hypothetical protein
MPRRRVREWSHSSTVLDLDNRWRWVVSFTSRLFYPRGKSPRYPSDRGAVETWHRSGRREKKINLAPIGKTTILDFTLQWNRILLAIKQQRIRYKRSSLEERATLKCNRRNFSERTKTRRISCNSCNSATSCSELCMSFRTQWNKICVT